MSTRLNITTNPRLTQHRVVPAVTQDCPPGQVIVATEVNRPGHPPLGCPAAALLAGSLSRAGVATTCRPLRVSAEDSTDGFVEAQAGLVSWLSSWTDDTGHSVALAAAARVEDALSRRAAAVVVRDWSMVAGRRRLVLAAPRSFCAGVERAIEIVQRLLAQRGVPIYVRKQIVHNTHVVADLEHQGAVFVDELDEVPSGATVVFSAHGVSPAVRAQAAGRGLDVVDGTCPLVTKVHAEARRFAGRGDTVVLVGHAGHEETEGTLGEAPDRTVLVQTVADVERLEITDPARVSYLTQTTLSERETAEVIAALRRRFPAIRAPHSADICYATTNRQHAVEVVAAESDLVLVVGSNNSSNSLRLTELCQTQGTPAYLIDDVGAIHPDWLAGVSVVGLTAGASAPPAVVSDVITALRGLGPVTVTERQVSTESIHFALPRTVRPS
jgi:4-hydroxy-3-methylbut-2-enyl diphosphate reductase